MYTEYEIIKQKIADQKQIIKSADNLLEMAYKEKEQASDKILTLQSQLRKMKKATAISIDGL